MDIVVGWTSLLILLLAIGWLAMWPRFLTIDLGLACLIGFSLVLLAAVCFAVAAGMEIKEEFRA